MPIHPDVLVLPAFSTDDYDADTGDPDELRRWLDAYEFDRLDVPGGDPRESVREMALDVATENAFRAGRRVVAALAGDG